MAIRYMDPVGGNDANDGTTFANRFKTFAEGATTGRVSPGDTVRIIASHDPNSIGNVTWTDGSTALTLAAAKTQTIDNCETGWTASSNVTCSTNTDRKQGSYSVTAAIGSSFTTGKVAYKALSALDLSAYQQVSLWFRSSVSLAPGNLELRLCSDSTGDTPVHTVPLPVASSEWSNTNWQIVVKDFATNLNASIGSISLYLNSDPGTPTIYLDNIIACKQAGASDCLTHLSLVGKKTVGEPEWYPLLSIDGTAVVIGADYAISATSAARPYNGTTETVATYARQPLCNIDANRKNWFDVSGTVSSKITFSGGWNRTDMSTQTGETWISGSHHDDNVNSTPIYAGSLYDAVFSNIGLCHCKLFGCVIGGSRLSFDLNGIVGCSTPISIANYSANVTLDAGNVMHNGAYFGENAQLFGFGNRFIASRVEGSQLSGVRGSGSALSPVVFDIGKIDNNATYGLASQYGNIVVRGATFADNASGSIDPSLPGTSDAVVCAGCTFPSEPTNTSTYNSQIRLHNYNATANDHRTIAKTWRVDSDSSVLHTASGIAWKLTLTDIDYDGAMRYFPLAKVAVNSGSQVNIKAWTRRSNAALSIGIAVLANSIAGVSADVTDEITVSADTWEELSIVFTPSEAGVVELFGYAYSTADGHSGWWDDLTISQA